MRKRKTEDKKNILSLTVATVAVLISVFWAVFIIVKNVSEKNVFAIYNGEEAVCFVSTRHEAEDAVRLCTEKISSTEVNADFEGITISLTKRFFPETVSSETASELVFESLFPGLVRCYAVIIDNEKVAFCKSYDDAETVIDELKESALKSLIELSPENEQIAFNNVFEIVSTLENRSRVIMSVEEARENIIGNDTNTKASEQIIDESRVESISGKNSSLYENSVEYGVSVQYNTSTNKVYDVNYGNTNIHVDFSHVKTITYTEILNYDTIYIDSNKLYVGDMRISSPGSYGTVRRTVLIKQNDDGTNTREVLSSEIIVPAKDEVVLKGIKKYPSTKPTGSFIWPLNKYVITSYFGEYRDEFDKKTGGHLGMDLGVESGYPVMAADGGTVIFAEMVSSYGNLIKIQHEEGVVTYYAHLSEILVNVGDRIYKGQTIANVGMTGAATGPHLHFEVRMNGKSVDPLKYLPQK